MGALFKGPTKRELKNHEKLQHQLYRDNRTTETNLINNGWIKVEHPQNSKSEWCPPFYRKGVEKAYLVKVENEEFWTTAQVQYPESMYPILNNKIPKVELE